jgi:hypothetical protein
MTSASFRLCKGLIPPGGRRELLAIICSAYSAFPHATVSGPEVSQVFDDPDRGES